MLDLVEKGNLTTNRRYMAMVKINKHIGEASVFILEHPPEPHGVISSQSSDRVKLVLHRVMILISIRIETCWTQTS